jgi:Transposase
MARYVTSLVHLEGGRLLELVADRTRRAVDAESALGPVTGWPGSARSCWTPGAATPARWSLRLATAGWSWTTCMPSGWPTWWWIRFAGACGRDPRPSGPQAGSLYRIRSLLLVAAEQLTGRGRARLLGWPPVTLVVRWRRLAGQGAAPAAYAASDLADARAALEHFYRWADGVRVAKLCRLAHTIRAWEAEILAFHATDGLLQRPTEAVNLLSKKAKWVGYGFRNFANYRLWLLLHCGVRWQTHQTTSLRGPIHAWWRRAA